ncbi:HAD family hydrolase [Planctomicrobium sp. SH661]|uniref:HAD family hydrolase n=1 Tax=Planctomicrobium sp. SH661 TaxID=3448124 RepID=UPI003F5AE0CB
MPLGLAEYLVSLEERPDLIWPQPPAVVPLKARPFLNPLPGIRLVTFNVYGTLLQIDGGDLLHLHPQEFRMQIAIEKTIKEFNMWNSMTRKAGQPWEAMLRIYQSTVEDVGMASTKKKGDLLELDSRKVWKKIIERLQKNEYVWDEGKYGDLEDFSTKVAYFFHASLQGTASEPTAVQILELLRQGGIRSGLIADGQAFTLPQLFHQLKKQSSSHSVRDLLSADCVVISSQIGVKKPSETLYRQAVSQFEQRGIAPAQVLHVSHRLTDDLAVAKKYGFHTALYAADKTCCRVQGTDLQNPAWKPDRLITQLGQLREILSL